MGCDLDALVIDALEPLRLGRFWAGVLSGEVLDRSDAVVVRPADAPGFDLRFVATSEPKVGRNRMHFDLTSTTHDDQRRTVARSVRLGARPIDVGQRPEEGHVVLADPEGNEFCVIEPGNAFLADCGFIGALAGDGRPEVGYFWSKALGWPLVWDQDQETAIRSPRGGPKISWGGPPPMPRVGRERWRFDLVPSTDSDLRSEVARLTGLGAVRAGVGRGGDGQSGAGQSGAGRGSAGLGRDDRGDDHRIALADPDGNEFWVLPARAD